MRTTFAGFEVARRALQAQQRALDVTGHNIANANTPGFSRQRAALTTTNPYTIPSMTSPPIGQIGTGVQVSSITRLRDGFTDYQFRSENQSLGYWEAQWQTFERLEGIFAEPSAAGLKTAISEFFNAWQDLSKDGSSQTVRAIVRQRAQAVTDMFSHIYSQLEDTNTDLNEGIALAVNDINSLAEQIATLNTQIKTAELTGYVANDLRDRRDLLVDELSKLVNINVFEGEGQFAITVNGTSLVRDSAVTKMQLSAPDADGLRNVVWRTADGRDGLEVKPTNGQLAGMIDVREKVVAHYMNELNTMAAAFANAVNDVHTSGVALIRSSDPDGEPTWQQGVEFFVARDGSGAITAKNLSLNPLIADTEAGLDYIAAASNTGDDDAPAGRLGDGNNALKLGQLRNNPIASLGDTIEQFYGGLLGTLGVSGQQALRLTHNQTYLVDQLQLRRASVSGVSLDEEMTDLIRFQHAYNAAARLMTVMDEALDVLINRTGLR